MKKAFNWSITIIGIACLIFLAGMFTGRNSKTPLERTPVNSFASEYTEPTLTLININTADEALLATLPGIGDVLAKRIVAYREENGPFASTSQLRAVDGIGPGKLEAIIALICTEE